MKISQVSIDGRVRTGPFRVVAAQPIELEGFQAKSPSLGSKLLSGSAASLVSERAWSGFQATNTLGADEMAKFLVKNGLAAEHAPNVAEQAMQVIRSEPTKLLLVAVSAGGTAWAAVEASRSLLGFRVSRLAQAIVALVTAALAAGLYHYLKSKGIAA